MKRLNSFKKTSLCLISSDIGLLKPFPLEYVVIATGIHTST